MKRSSDCLVSDVLFDVLIVGAGPVGLSIAIALKKRGINNILAIDRASSFRRVGQRVDILPNGLKAIKYIDEQAYEKLIETSSKSFTVAKQKNPDSSNSKLEKEKVKKLVWHQKNLQGEIIRSTPLYFATWFNLYGEGRVSIPWYDLQTILRNLLPTELVQANHRCINVSQKDGYVEVNCSCNHDIATNPFANWEMQKSGQTKIDSIDKSENQQSIQKQFKAKLVVAADGINSTIRQIVYNDLGWEKWAKPQYSGFVAIACLEIENVPDEITQELEAKYFQGEGIITLQDHASKSNNSDLGKPWIMLMRKQKNTFGYLLHTPLNLELLQNKSSKEIINLAASILEQANFPGSIVNLVSLSNLKKVFQRPYYIHPADISNNNNSQLLWSDGRLVLAGDSAHGMPPFAAQGVNQGFEDAALLSTLIVNLVDNKFLDNEDIIQSKFRKYEEIRRPFMIEIQSATMENKSWSQKKWDSYNKMVYGRDLEQLISQVNNK